MLPMGIENMNHCRELGAPRVPILTAQGGDLTLGRGLPPGLNDRAEWTRSTMEEVREGRLKRVRLIPMLTAADAAEGDVVDKVKDQEQEDNMSCCKRPRKSSPVRVKPGPKANVSKGLERAQPKITSFTFKFAATDIHERQDRRQCQGQDDLCLPALTPPPW